MLDGKPDVSVIIATYNRLWALPEAMASCRKGNCHTEIIVVDDGSTDGTWAWLQAQKDVVAIRTDNWGQCWAHNAGIAASSGQFIRFLESDDWILDGANDRQLEIARATSADVVVAGYEHHNQIDGRTTSVPWVDHDDFFIGQIHTDCCYSAYLMRRSIVTPIPHREEYAHHDSTFLIELALAKPKVAVADFSSVAVRIHSHTHVSDRHGLRAAIAAWRTIVLYKKIMTLLAQKGECTEPRKKALLLAVFDEARKLAEWSIEDASSVVDWIHGQDSEFMPPRNSAVDRLRGVVGFKMTERAISVCRRILHAPGLRRRSF